MADDQANFEILLQNLMSNENDARCQSEEVYEKISPSNKMTFLIQAMGNSNIAIEVRTLSAVLLRRLFTANFDEFWKEISPELQLAIKQQMLISIKEELTPPVRKKVCESTAELARNMLDDDNNMTWPEVLTFLFDCANSADPSLKECALQIFSIVPGIFGNQQTQRMDMIKMMLTQCMHDRQHPQVQTWAIRATVAFISSNDKDTAVHQHFKDLLPAIIQGVADSVAAHDDDSLIKCLIELAESTPKYLRSQMENIIPMCLKFISDVSLPDKWRQLALEVIVTLAETAPGMVRKFSKFIPLLVPQVLALMVDLEEEPDWSTQDDDEDDDNESNAIAAESSLDRLACGLGGKTMLPHIVANIPPMLSHNDWRYRHAALMAISACGEGCHQQMEIMLPNIVDAVLPFLKDPHPRVRYAACNAIGQMCQDFGPIFQKKFHEKVVHGLLLVMDDDENPRVQGHGAAAIVNFSEECPKALLAKYLDVIMDKLELVLTKKFKELLDKGNKLVLEHLVTALASVADTAEEKFIQYYDRFMPCLKYIVQNACSADLRLLKGKTIECISLIGLAVGKEKFMQDCSDVMQLLLQTQSEKDMPDDDPQMSYMISAWARMCKILGPEFQQYLPLVMGPVLKAASIKPEVALVDSDEMKTMEDDSDWQFVTLGDQQSFGIRTAGLDEKATACQMLVCYARELKEAFAPYTDEVVQIMVPLLKFYFHDEVRVAASDSLPSLLECAKIRGEEYVVKMWDYICPELLKAVDMEPEMSVLPEHMKSLSGCIECLGKGCLSEPHMNQLIQTIDKMLKQHFEKQDERQEKRQDEDYDDVMEESLLNEDDEDVYILSKISNLIHSLFGTHKESFLPMFEQLLLHFVRLLDANRPWPDRQWALCIWDDVLEHTGPNSIKYQEYFFPPLVECISHKQTEVCQAATYGVGVMAQFGGELYAAACAETIPHLIKVIQDPDSRTVERLPATDNAISAVTKICKYNSSNVNVNDILGLWLSWLPIWEDEDEVQHVYGYLCDLVEGNHPVILGDNNKNLPQILAIIGEVFHREVLSEDDPIFQRMGNIVRQLHGNLEMFQMCVSHLTQEQQAGLAVLFS